MMVSYNSLIVTFVFPSIRREGKFLTQTSSCILANEIAVIVIAASQIHVFELPMASCKLFPRFPWALTDTFLDFHKNEEGDTERRYAQIYTTCT